MALSRRDLDVASRSSVEAALERYRPQIVINAAAYTSVDAAEGDESAAYAVNSLGPGLLAAAMQRVGGGRLVHVSTDYVFSGTGHVPYESTDAPAPLTAYGRTKLAGEVAALDGFFGGVDVVRTAWVYGGPGANFVDTMIRLESERETVDVVADQTGSPTWVVDLATALIELGQRTVSSPRVVHYVNSGRATWYQLACETFRLIGADPARVRPGSAPIRAKRLTTTGTRSRGPS